MQTIDTQLENVQHRLEQIIKVYPPYPPESMERINVLRQFSALRIMIDRLANPQEADCMVNILGNPEENPSAGPWQLTDGTQSLYVHIHPQPVHSGKGGLNLVQDETSQADEKQTDNQLPCLLDQIIQARQTLFKRRQGFNADANRVIDSINDEF